MSNIVRYVTSSSGSKIRSTPAGTQVITLLYGELMYDIVGVAKVTASLNGVSYVWVKVHYYHINSDNTTSDGEGWIAETYTAVVSATHPGKPNVYYNNTSQQFKRFTNARYIYDYFHNAGWSSNAIYAVLGNMERESRIDTTTQNNIGAYGLVQWYPSTKLTNWLPPGADSSDIDNQLNRILFESNNALQWEYRMPAGEDQLSFAQFKVSTKTVTKLSEYL